MGCALWTLRSNVNLSKSGPKLITEIKVMEIQRGFGFDGRLVSQWISQNLAKRNILRLRCHVGLLIFGIHFHSGN